ncbi:MAG: enoyl-CoA hydratase [Sedimentitalea sp.]|nr:enoyl-CoA hydratase [Sedimentitalea sp.]
MTHPHRSVGRRATAALLSVTMGLGLASCRIPADPDGTTEKVSGGSLAVGALMRPLDGADAEAVRRIAAALNAELRLVEGDPHSLFAMLERGEIDLVAGRLPADTPFAAEVGLSKAIGKLEGHEKKKDRVLALRRGENRFLGRVNAAVRGMAE